MTTTLRACDIAAGKVTAAFLDVAALYSDTDTPRRADLTAKLTATRKPLARAVKVIGRAIDTVPSYYDQLTRGKPYPARDVPLIMYRWLGKLIGISCAAYQVADLLVERSLSGIDPHAHGGAVEHITEAASTLKALAQATPEQLIAELTADSPRARPLIHHTIDTYTESQLPL